jgi:hypothetical protein
MHTQDEEEVSFGFGGAEPRPCSARAGRIANATLALLEVQKDLDEARRNVPSYTGQWRDADYTAEAQEAWNRAADALEAAIDGKS